MRTGISITLKPADRRRLKALARDRNTPHKHVWQAEIVLLSADNVGTNEIMCESAFNLDPRRCDPKRLSDRSLS